MKVLQIQVAVVERVEEWCDGREEFGKLKYLDGQDHELEKVLRDVVVCWKEALDVGDEKRVREARSGLNTAVERFLGRLEPELSSISGGGSIVIQLDGTNYMAI